MFKFMIGTCARNKAQRILKHGEAKLEKEFDVLKMIRHHRLLACQMAGLLTPDQTKFAQLLAHQVLSEPLSTESEEVETFKEFTYLETCLASNSAKNQRFLQHFKD